MVSIELRQIQKTYGAVQANRDVSVHVQKGTIHAIVGENGAGKSTAMRILSGIERPDSGKILIDGKEEANWGSKLALANGVGMVHQHFLLAGSESVLDNIVLGAEKTRWALRDRKAERAQVESLMARTGLKVGLSKRVRDLSVGEQSRCEILRPLYRNASFLILDEPTAVLTPQEVDEFLIILKALRAEGRTIVLITHKLREVLAVADEVSVLRAGAIVAKRSAAGTTAEELSELMVGRKLALPKVKGLVQLKSDPVLSLKAPFELQIRPGEILGIAGVEGNGQESLIAAVGNMRNRPIAYVPPDRHKEGLVLDFTLSENLSLGRRQKSKKFWKSSSPTKAREQAETALLREYDVRPADRNLTARALSGGNQQKLIFARELGELEKRKTWEGSILVCAHPTRGVDLGAIEFLHKKIISAAENGAAVLLVSSELEELMSLSHRIGVLYRGEIRGWFEGPIYNESKIGLVMTTGRDG